MSTGKNCWAVTISFSSKYQMTKINGILKNITFYKPCVVVRLLGRALHERKTKSGDRMPIPLIGDVLAKELAHMQPYIRFCSCQINGAELLQIRTNNEPDFKTFLKV